MEDEEIKKEYLLDPSTFDWKLYGLLIFLLGSIERLSWTRKLLVGIFLGYSISNSYNMLREYCMRLGIPMEAALEYWADHPKPRPQWLKDKLKSKKK